MNNIKKSIEDYCNALGEINKYFDRQGNFPPEDMTDVYWLYEGFGGVHFDYVIPDNYRDEDYEFQYCLEVVRGNIVIKDDYTWVLNDDSCGNVFPVILDNSKRLFIENDNA